MPDDEAGHKNQSNEGQQGRQPSDENHGQKWFSAFLNPVVAIAVLILLGILFLIASAILGLDKGGVLEAMGRVEYARGLITYLFAVVTIGTAVLLIVFALTRGTDPVHQDQFDRGKEILSLLLGVFGTIVGFYFGSEVAKGGEVPLRVATIRMVPAQPTPQAKFTFYTLATGGRPPYHYSVGFDKAPLETTESVDSTGWITREDLTAPSETKDLVVRVQDADGHTAEQSTKVPPK
jgi:hypothetical protein